MHFLPYILNFRIHILAYFKSVRVLSVKLHKGQHCKANVDSFLPFPCPLFSSSQQVLMQALCCGVYQNIEGNAHFA